MNRRIPFKLLGGIFLGFSFWILLFGGFSEHFWFKMTVFTLILGSYSIVLGGTRIERGEWSITNIAVGIIAALVLYAIFKAGGFILQWIFPHSSSGIDTVYALKQESDPRFLTALLLIIGPLEEIFWRGYVQREICTIYNPLHGVVFASLIYCVVHLPAQNPVLLIAALTGGLFWGLLYVWTQSLVPGIVSHAIWDALIFVIWPITTQL